MDNKNQNSQKEEAKLLSEYITNVKSKQDGKDPNSYTRDEISKIYQSEGFQKYKQSKKTKAAHGAKLQYFRTLKNQCPEGEELYYYKKGGSVGCGCKKKEDGGEVRKAGLGCSTIDKFKAIRKGKSGFDITAFADATGSQGGFANAKPKRKTPKKGTWAETTKYIPGQTIQRGNGGPDAKVQDSAVRDRKNNPENIVKKEKGDKIIKKFKAARCGSKMKKHQQGGSLNGIPFIRKELLKEE